jgi:hypothetical protein
VLERPIIVHHAAVPLGLDGGLLEAWLAVLPRQRRAGLEAQDAVACTASVLGLALLASAARERGQAVDWSAVEFPDGEKPRWRGGCDFSIAHAGARAACALAPPGVSVGLDLESRATVTGQSIRLVTSAEERALFDSAGLDTASLWTRKEAVLKAAGRGVREVAAVQAGIDTAVFEGRRYALLDVSLAPGLACSVALSDRTLPLAVSERDGSQLLAAGP